MITLVLAVSSAMAADTHITFSARALDAEGTPINGTLPVAIRLMDSDVGGSDVELWDDVFTTTSVSDGYFSVVLGSDDPLSADLFRDNPAVWVEATIGTTTLDRQQLADVPTAAMARAVTLPAPSASCTSGALAYDAGSAEVEVCVAGVWSPLTSQAQIECTSRGGEWTGSGCIEYAVKGCDSCTGFADFVSSCSAIANYHPCTYGEFPLALRSIYGQVQDDEITVASGYMWVAGYNVEADQTTTGNQLWYPWGASSGSSVSNRMVCGSDSAVMFGVFQPDSNSLGANGCYDKDYTNALGACCRDFPF